jgi:4-carboxymuconolactone decarboxylase
VTITAGRYAAVTWGRVPSASMERNEEKRRLGFETMKKVYGWEDVGDAPGDFFGYTAEHLFGEIWNREGLTFRERRLLLIGLLVGRGIDDVLGLQLDAALGNEELSADELREIVIFLTHYAGWPSGAKLNNQVEALIARAGKQR